MLHTHAFAHRLYTFKGGAKVQRVRRIAVPTIILPKSNSYGYVVGLLLYSYFFLFINFARVNRPNSASADHNPP